MLRFSSTLNEVEISKVEKYITKKSKKWFNIDAKIQSTVYGKKLLHIKYTLEDKEPSCKNWQHDHRILIEKIK